MSDEQGKDETEWNFEVEGVKTEGENVERKARKERLAQKLGQKEEKRDAQKDLIDSKKPKRMSLDAAPSSARRSRSKVAEEMRKAELPDFSDLMASPVKRIIAGAIDGAIFFGLLFVANSFWETIKGKVLGILRDNSVNQPLDPETFKMVIMGAIAVAIYYVVIALPVCFTKQSWGKSFTNLRVESADEEKDLGFFGVVFREFVAKPISIITVLGNALMFFNSDNRNLQDFVSGTVVMDDSIDADTKKK